MVLSIVGGIILSLALSVYSEISKCPSTNISPCSCNDDEYPAFVVCAELRSLRLAYPALYTAVGKNRYFTFRKSTIGEIQKDFFQGKQIIELYFEECKIESLGSRPFAGLENTLKTLLIDDSKTHEGRGLQTLPLGHLQKLEFLSFEGNALTTLGNDWFNGGPTSLKKLFLKSNGIEELGDRAFTSLVNIEQIWLGNNSIKQVSRSMFPRPACHLFILDFSFNGLSELPEDMFEYMPVLEILKVDGNKFQTVGGKPWEGIWNQLKEVNLEHNFGFVCDQHIKWIYRRKLPKALIGQCPISDNRKLSRKALSEIKLGDFD